MIAVSLEMSDEPILRENITKPCVFLLLLYPEITHNVIKQKKNEEENLCSPVSKDGGNGNSG